MSWQGSCVSPFRCLTTNRPRAFLVPEEEVCRKIDYRRVRELYQYIYPSKWSPLTAAFLSDKNLHNVSMELARRVNKATGLNVFIELDNDENLQNTIIDILSKNEGRDWSTKAVRCLNEVFLTQATHDVVYGLRQRGRNERLLTEKAGPQYLMERPLGRTIAKYDIDMNPTYLTLTHPFAKSRQDYDNYLKQQFLGEKPHGVLIHAPYAWW